MLPQWAQCWSQGQKWEREQRSFALKTDLPLQAGSAVNSLCQAESGGRVKTVAVDSPCLFSPLLFSGMMNLAHGFGFASEFFLCDKWGLATWGLVVNLSLWATPLLPGIPFVTVCSVGLTKLSGQQRAELLEFIVESSGRKWNCSPPQRRRDAAGKQKVWAENPLWCFVSLEN